MSKFCNDCGSLLTPITGTGELTFMCRCGKSYPSTPDDSLRAEEFVEGAQKYAVFIDNSASDTAGKRVEKECPNCRAPFITQIYIGAAETILYTCECGAKYTLREYAVAKTGKTSED